MNNWIRRIVFIAATLECDERTCVCAGQVPRLAELVATIGIAIG